MISHKIIKAPQRSFGVVIAGPKLVFSQAEIDTHIQNMKLSVGDLVYYTRSSPASPLEAPALSYVAAIEKDPLKVKAGYSSPKTFLLMQLTGTSHYCRAPEYKFSKQPWCRWDDGIGMIKADEELIKELVDDYVQNYIQEYAPRALEYVR